MCLSSCLSIANLSILGYTLLYRALWADGRFKDANLAIQSYLSNFSAEYEPPLRVLCEIRSLIGAEDFQDYAEWAKNSVEKAVADGKIEVNENADGGMSFCSIVRVGRSRENDTMYPYDNRYAGGCRAPAENEPRERQEGIDL